MSARAIVFMACVAACVVAHIAIVISSLTAQPVAQGDAVPKPRPAIEFLWALVPIVALAFLLTATWNRITDNERHPPAAMKLAR